MDKELLLKPRVPEGQVELPVGTVTVRGLTRAEVFVVQKFGTTVELFERKMLALGMVDPQLTESEAGRWQAGSPAGEIEPIVDKIRELSGLADDSEKQAMATFRDEPGDGVRVLPGAEAVDDGGPAPGADEQ